MSSDPSRTCALMIDQAVKHVGNSEVFKDASREYRPRCVSCGTRMNHARDHFALSGVLDNPRSLCEFLAAPVLYVEEQPAKHVTVTVQFWCRKCRPANETYDCVALDVDLSNGTERMCSICAVPKRKNDLRALNGDGRRPVCASAAIITIHKTDTSPHRVTPTNSYSKTMSRTNSYSRTTRRTNSYSRTTRRTYPRGTTVLTTKWRR